MIETLAQLRAALSNQYLIERELGRGGMSAVYLAHDTRHDRKVALKVLHPELMTSIGSQRFLREIRTTARLNHPHILAMHDSGEAAGLLYYTMPYVDGETLRGRLDREGRLSIDDAVTITVEIADTLSYAHAHGIVHRDIKPENILFSRSGHLWVADFGLARAFHTAASQDITASGHAVGSPRYMSPEQGAGEKTVDGRSDIYSLACVAYEMLTGSPPFTGGSARAVIARHVTVPAPPVKAVRSDTPDHVSDALEKALAKSPDARFATAAQFAKMLDPSTRPAAYTLRPWVLRPRFTRVTRRTAITAGGATLVLAIGLGLFESRISDPVSKARDLVPHRVIVTPFENRTGTSNLDAVGLMAADWITAGLHRVRRLEVVPTTTAFEVFRFVSRDRPAAADVDDPIRKLGIETGARMVVTGAIYRRTDRLLFRVQVNDAQQRTVVATLDDVETSTLDPMGGIEEIRARLMGWFASQRDARASVAISEGVRPPLYQAYVAFSDGLEHYISNRFASALPHFLRANIVDSSFAAPLLFASLCLSNLGEMERSDSVLSVLERRRSTLSDYDRAWLDYRRGFLAGDHDAALRAIRTAARLVPDSKAAYNHAVAAFQSGRPREALIVLQGIVPERGAMRGFLPYWDMLAAVYHALGQYEREAHVGRVARRLYPERVLAYMPSVRAYAINGRLDTLEVLFRRAASLRPDPGGQSYGALLVEGGEELRAHGHAEASRDLLRRAGEWYRRNNGSGLNAWAIARIAYATADYAATKAALNPLLAKHPQHAAYLGQLGLVYARLGQRDSAERISEKLARVPKAYQFGAPASYRARIAAVFGDRDAAVAQLRESFEQGKEYDLWLHRDIDLTRLKGYPPFDALVERGN